MMRIGTALQAGQVLNAHYAVKPLKAIRLWIYHIWRVIMLGRRKFFGSAISRALSLRILPKTGRSSLGAASKNGGVWDVTMFGATGDGSTDDTQAIQHAIDVSPSGAIILFPPGTYLVRGLLLRGGRTYAGTNWTSNGTTIRLGDGAHAAAALMSADWADESTTVGRPVDLHDLHVDGNRAANPGSHGLLLMNWLCNLEHVSVQNCGGDGLHLASRNRAGDLITTTAVESYIRRCRVFDVGGSGVVAEEGNKITDGFIVDTIVGKAGRHGVELAHAAGWVVSGNHVYAVGQHGFAMQFSWRTRIALNYIESFGRDPHAGPVSGISLQNVLEGGGTIVAENHVCTADMTVHSAIHVGVARSQKAAVLLQGNDLDVGNAPAIDLALRGGQSLRAVVSGNMTRGPDANALSVGPGAISVLSSGNSFQFR